MQSLRVIRRWGVMCSCLASLVVGIALLWRLISPQTIGRVLTIELLIILGLLVIPVLAVWASIVRRRGSVRARSAEPADAPARHRKVEVHHASDRTDIARRRATPTSRHETEHPRRKRAAQRGERSRSLLGSDD